MDYSKVFEISSAGMNVERTRVDVAALNLANANTVLAPGGVQYQPARVVSFAARVDRAGGGDSSLLLPEASVEATAAAPRMVYEPGHPFANERGFVAYPGVDTASEMVSLMTALRAYEANVAALNTARTLAQKALDIGGAT